MDEIKASWGERVTSKDDCVEELVCNSVMAIASDEGAMAKAVGSVKNKSILERLAEAIKNLAGRIKEFILNRTTNKAARIFAQDAQALERLAEMFSEAADKISGAKNENGQKNNTGEGVVNEDKKFSVEDELKTNIYPNMNETLRAKVLKNSKIKLAVYDSNNSISGHEISMLENAAKNQAYKILKALGEKFGIYKSYSNQNVEMTFDYTKSTLKESLNKQQRITTDYNDFAKMLTVFDDIVKNAVPIEVHTDKYVDTKRHNPDLKYDYVLLSAFMEDNYIVPVEFHIKEYKQRKPDKLYVSVTLGKIKIEDSFVAITTKSKIEAARNMAQLPSNISVPQLISKVNNNLGDLYKYIPDELLNEIQLKSKRIAVEKDNQRLSEMRNESAENKDKSDNKYVDKYEDKRKDLKFSVDDTITQSEQFVKWFGDWQNNPKSASKIVDGSGEPLVVYHQTDSDFTVFDTSKKGAGEYDSEMPTGIFMKPTPSNIGLNGDRQMALYANIRNPFIAISRKELVDFYIKNIDGYSDAKNEVKRIDSEYKQKFQDEMKRENQEYQKLWVARKNGEISEEEYQKAVSRDALDDLLEEWHNKVNEASKKAKGLIDDYFKNSNYDGVIVNNDAGSFGRATKTFIAFKNTQVKSASDNVGTFDENIPDIRYIMDDTLNDWLDDFNSDTPKGIDYERVVEKNPVVAVANIYRSAAKTAESGLRQSRRVKLEQKEYISIAHKIMSNYDIKPKLNPGYAEELAGQLESLVKNAGAKNADFAELFESFVEDCKGGILLSGGFDKTMMQEERYHYQFEPLNTA